MGCWDRMGYKLDIDRYDRYDISGFHVGCWDNPKKMVIGISYLGPIPTGGIFGDISGDINGMLMEYWLIPSGMLFFEYIYIYVYI